MEVGKNVMFHAFIPSQAATWNAFYCFPMAVDRRWMPAIVYIYTGTNGFSVIQLRYVRQSRGNIVWHPDLDWKLFIEPFSAALCALWKQFPDNVIKFYVVQLPLIFQYQLFPRNTEHNKNKKKIMPTKTAQ